MNVINNITVFDNDQFFMGLLSGYCYTNGIPISELEFNITNIKELEIIRPDLVFFSLELLDTHKEVLEEFSLILSKVGKQTLVCGLNKTPVTVYADIPKWIETVINNTTDISAIDRFIKSRFLLNIFSAEDRRRLERRSFNERRIDGSNNVAGYDCKTASRNEFESLEINDFKIDQHNKCVYLKGKKVDLTRKEYELFELLSTGFDHVYTAEEIINHLWPDNNRATKSDLYQYMHLLRKKIEKDPNNPRWIITVKGFGYRLNPCEQDKVGQDEICY